MSNYPDLSVQGYQIISQLGANSMGGRVTYLAKDIKTQNHVVIKQFQFAQMGATWAEYEAYQQEITMLRRLNHPNIPRYLNSFQTPDGFCMVQAYINAQSLATPRSWIPQQIKQVAIAVLEILVYLQSQSPAIIHRDIKPENILVEDNPSPTPPLQGEGLSFSPFPRREGGWGVRFSDIQQEEEERNNSQFKVYLVDFGFARMGGGEIAASSVVKGTLGFMPPEQLFNRQLTAASDLYGLGITLISLLTGTKSVDIGNLIDANYRIHFQHLVPPLKRGWLNWLEKMTEPRVQNRYRSAAEALASLKNIDVDSLPKVILSQNRFNFNASQFGEKLTETIPINNPIPNTVMSGRWEVAPHPNDPPHTPYDHTWISFNPQKFEGNQVECKITVDTSKLLANQTYNRQIILHANSVPDTYTVTVEVQTAPLPPVQKPDYLYFLLLGILFLLSLFLLSQIHDRIILAKFMLMGTPTLLVLLNLIDKINQKKLAGIKTKWISASLGAAGGQLVGIFFGLSVFDWDDIGWLIGGITGGIIGTLVGFHDSNSIIGGMSVIILLLTSIALPTFMNMSYSAEDISFVTSWLLQAPILNLLIGYLTTLIVKYRRDRRITKKEDSLSMLLTAGLGINLAGVVLLRFSLMNQIAQNFTKPGIAVISTGIAIAPIILISILWINYIIYKPLKHNKKIAKYHKSQADLIKP